VRNAFLLKPCPPEEFLEKVMWCLDDEHDKNKIYSKDSKNIDEKMPVSSDVFLKINTIPCDVYVKLGAEKYVKIINKNELFLTEIILRLIAKGVESFFINKSELSNYSESIVQNLYSILKRKKIKIDEAAQSQTTNKALQIIKNSLIKCGFSNTIIAVTEEVVNIQVDMIKRSPELSGFMEKFQLFRKMNTEHSRLVSFFTVAILKEIGWDSESTLHNMCLASLLHDISLPEDFAQKLSGHDHLSKLSDSDKQLYEHHSEESAHLAKHFSAIAQGIEQVIHEHHELPDGTGFPRRLTAQLVHPLSACLHMADVTAYYMWEEDFDADRACAILMKKKEFYSKGFYRKPFDAMLKVLGK
jgi:HD-GYP domain-containing protein (c-di-GMP phosphodiesterase class II)